MKASTKRKMTWVALVVDVFFCFWTWVEFAWGGSPLLLLLVAFWAGAALMNVRELRREEHPR